MPQQPNHEQTTATFLGIWLDHSRAEIVELQGNAVRQSTIASEVERKHRALGGTRMPGKGFMSSFGASEHKSERHRGEQLARFFKQLIPSVQAADRVFLLGPGLAKNEFAAVLKKQKALQGRLDPVETKPALSPRQLVAFVKRHFEQPLTQ